MAKVELKKPIVEEIKANLDGAATAVVVANSEGCLNKEIYNS